MATIQEYENAVQKIKRLLEIINTVRGDLQRFSDYASDIQADPLASSIAQDHFTPGQISKLQNAKAWADNRVPELDQFILDLDVGSIYNPPQ